MKVFKCSSILFGDIVQLFLENQAYFMKSLWVLTWNDSMLNCPFLLTIEELETKLLNILQDLQCSSRSNSKWVGEAFSQRQGDWILVCRWVKLKLKMKNESRHIDESGEADSFFELWRPSHFSIYISIVCLKGWVRSIFITPLWNFEFYMNWFCTSNELLSYEATISIFLFFTFAFIWQNRKTIPIV